MKKILFIFLFFNNFLFAQSNPVDTIKVRADFEKIILNLKLDYVYHNKKDVDLDCLKKQYASKIGTLKNDSEVLLFFEYLLDEFYDSHLHLQTNNQNSYRLYSPIYVSTIGNKTTVSSIWKDQIESKINIDLMDAEVLTLNGVEFNEAIENFPTHCQNKNNDEIRSWISNKILAGRYNEPRVITLKTISGSIETFNLDSIKLKKESSLVSSNIQDSVGIIRINNSLGNLKTIKEFKEALNQLKNTKGLILDLRNTVDGGNTNVANPIAGHFTNEKQVFQKYRNSKTQFVDYIKPKKPYFNKPLVVLVGRWTGSMGEGLAAGFDGCGIAKIVGTKMHRLAGGTKDYHFTNFDFGYQMPYIEVLQQNNEPREKFIPKYKVVCNSTESDEFLLSEN